MTLILAGQSLAQELESHVAESLPAVVSIRAETPEGSMSGSGFIIDSSGMVVMNLHVIQGVEEASSSQVTAVPASSTDSR